MPRSAFFRLSPRLLVAAALLTAAGLAAQPGSTIRFALPAATNITYLFPITPSQFYASVNIHYVQSLLYRPLVFVNSKVQVNYTRSLAQSVKTADGKHYFITLNPKWRWSDGQPVTAKDVLFDIRLLRSIPAGKSNLFGGWGGGGVPNDIVSARQLSRYRLEITLNGRYNPQWFILNGLSLITPLPKQAWDRYPGHPAKTLAYLQARGDSQSFFRSSPVDGPFKVSSLELNKRFIFAANPAYSGHRADYQRLVLTYFTSTDAEYNALRDGQIQVGYLPAHLYAQRQISGFRFWSTPLWAMYYMDANFKNRQAPELASLPVRQALQMAINQPGMVKAFLHGQGVAQYGPVPYVPPTYLSPYLKSTVPYPYNPRAGKRLLEASGWSLQGGVMVKGGQRLVLNLAYAVGSQYIQLEAEAIAAAAAKEGISVHLQPMPFGTLIAQLGKLQSWQLELFGGWLYGTDPYPSNYQVFNSQGGSNRGGYDDPKMNQLTVQTHLYASPSASLQALYRYQDYAAKTLPRLWMPVPDALNEVSTGLHGVRGHLYIGRFSPQYWSF
jgi:peptide/nickel transport system substrate-binding protein